MRHRGAGVATAIAEGVHQRDRQPGSLYMALTGLVEDPFTAKAFKPEVVTDYWQRRSERAENEVAEVNETLREIAVAESLPIARYVAAESLSRRSGA